jgi:exodeoxyribonuclease VIII
MKPGIYKNISNADYHSGPGVSKSMLDIIRNQSPLHLRHRLDSTEQRESTPAQMIGTAAHALILEPAEFVKNYTLALRQSDVPHAVADRDSLVAMVEKLNATRLPKLSSTGTKAELVDRIMAAAPGNVREYLAELAIKDLKLAIDAINESRPGLLSTTGTMDQLAALLRENGKDITLWSDVKAQWLANNGHRIVLSQDQWDKLHAMRDAVMAHPAACALLTNQPGTAEMSIYWTDEETGVLCRCRPDFLRHDGIVVDLKTTENAGAESFGKSILNWRYHVQDQFYTDGINASIEQSGAALPQVRAFAFIAVEKDAPHAVAVYTLDADSKALGRIEYRQDLQKYAECLQQDQWPGHGEKIQKLALPAWHIARNAALIGA